MTIRLFYILFLWLISIFSAPIFSAYAENINSDVVIMVYHRFDEPEYPSTNINTDILRQQLQILQDNEFHVISPYDMIEAYEQGISLPPKSIILTIDDAHKSFYQHGYPIFRDFNMPFTLFVSTEAVGAPHYMSWADINHMKQEAPKGSFIESQAVTHPHMPLLSIEDNYHELKQSADMIEKHTGIRPKFFAYPYGEASLKIMEMAKNLGYIAAFGQHSGVASHFHNRYYLPRFPNNETYGTLDKFQRRAQMKALHIANLTPKDPLVIMDTPSDHGISYDGMGMNILNDDINLSRLNCFQSRVGQIDQLHILGKNRIELRYQKPLHSGRNRINCTLLDKGQWHWFGMQYYVPSS
jgi:peptidoglycan/xylan/chitin deacetylase (PgdA/CDA1 family)